MVRCNYREIHILKTDAAPLNIGGDKNGKVNLIDWKGDTGEVSVALNVVSNKICRKKNRNGVQAGLVPTAGVK